MSTQNQNFEQLEKMAANHNNAMIHNASQNENNLQKENVTFQ
jgi:hypothetical protein